MKSVIEKYLKILRIELEDLDRHIERLVIENQDRLKRREVTEYVCLENVAVLRSEEFGIRHFINIVDRTDPDSFDGLDALLTHLREAFASEIERAGLAPAACRFAERKISKVHRYITASDGCLSIHPR